MLCNILFFLVSYRSDGSIIKDDWLWRDENLSIYLNMRIKVTALEKRKTPKLAGTQTSQPTEIFLTFIVVTAISLQFTDHSNLLLMNIPWSTKHINEEHFIDGRTLVRVMPLAEDSSNNEVGYFEELHTSGRWAILVYSVSYKMNRNIYTETHQHSIYIKFIAETC